MKKRLEIDFTITSFHRCHGNAKHWQSLKLNNGAACSGFFTVTITSIARDEWQRTILFFINNL